MEQKPQIRNGFSLVEMAVVIAIVGLLVGAIMAGSSYLSSSERSTSINEAKYYLGAFNQFIDLYQVPPGDMSNASSNWTGAGNGNGNGLVREDPTGTDGDGDDNEELFYAPQHLAKAGLIIGNYAGAAGPNGNRHGMLKPSGTTNANMPASAIADVGFYFDYPDGAVGGMMSGDADFFDGFWGHFLRMGKQPSTGNNPPNNAFLTPREALELDEKFDDSRPALGWIRVLKPAEMANCASADDTSSTYNTAYDLEACSFLLVQQ